MSLRLFLATLALSGCTLRANDAEISLSEAHSDHGVALSYSYDNPKREGFVIVGLNTKDGVVFYQEHTSKERP